MDGPRQASILLLCFSAKNDWTGTPVSLFCFLFRSPPVPPVSVSIVVADRNPTAGRPYSLPCFVAGSRPTPKITWWRFDQLLDPSAHNQVIIFHSFLTSSFVRPLFFSCESTTHRPGARNSSGLSSRSMLLTAEVPHRISTLHPPFSVSVLQVISSNFLLLHCHLQSMTL